MKRERCPDSCSAASCLGLLERLSHVNPPPARRLPLSRRVSFKPKKLAPVDRCGLNKVYRRGWRGRRVMSIEGCRFLCSVPGRVDTVKHSYLSRRCCSRRSTAHGVSGWVG